MLPLAPVAVTITAAQSAAIFLNIVYRHHGLPTSIISDRDLRFTAAFWTDLFKLVGTHPPCHIQRRTALPNARAGSSRTC
ncbi:hypothetical protein PF005_g16744 [Phytophthora fragariae]|uniref:Integrase catalytic domain-containing protein n=2 Tax=Phytophthora TaxID=4783 RepID=A0A6A3JT91_9STRA|nr:hypothetical protein PF009_g14404 [Phytophthora fragariae]KAE8993918.1 hypothetical protein PR002_g20090 [Phytophthora rubi]KAE8995394.1 hypothetical protein PF011_g16348 [Phytophthora fragariae]KAE8997069.1 hypothetical protein PR001_g19684 [Phytophthora rubi]KAE9103098.1 hypothetical protein PF010_g13862 [Phytophthora fragariae]